MSQPTSDETIVTVPAEHKRICGKLRYIKGIEFAMAVGLKSFRHCRKLMALD